MGLRPPGEAPTLTPEPGDGRLPLAASRPGLFSERIVERLKLRDPGQSIDLTIVTSPDAEPAELERLLSRPLWRWELRAPGVYELRLPSALAVDELVAVGGSRIRRVDAAGRVKGEIVLVPEDRVELFITFARVGGLTRDRRARLKQLGFTVVAEERDSIATQGFGRSIAGLLLAPFVGSIVIRNVDPA